MQLPVKVQRVVFFLMEVELCVISERRTRQE